jgi:SecD/SecF fusion protein
VASALIRWSPAGGGFIAREGAGKFKLGIDLAGGTILVYEINTERTRQLNAAREATGQRQPTTASTADDVGLSGEDMVKLAAQIKRRIDPADLKNVTVRPLGNRRIEIILPTAGGGTGDRTNLSAEEIEEVKSLVSQMGVLEFRILANKVDDEKGVQAAKDLIDNPTPDNAAKLQRAAEQGLAPPGPDEAFGVWVNEDESEKRSGSPPMVKYAWVELSAEERTTLGLNNESEGKSHLWPLLAQNRNRTYLYEYGAGDEEAGRRTASMLLYSRPVDPKSPQADKERRQLADLQAEGKADQFKPKKFEYFVLTRVSPADTVRVEGDISLNAAADMDRRTNKPCVQFTFNGAGARAFGKMTARNKPDKGAGGTIRALAIVLDDKIVSAPSLNAVISSSGQITGNFDRKSVDRLVNFLRNGALNAQLREKPVSENTIGPTLGADTIRKGTMAVGVAFLAVLVFMLFYYRFAGCVACIALLANLLLTIGFMVAVNAAFTLTGLAGLVLMLGMAVDANVLIYERLREERNKGANLATAIRNGYDRAFWTIIDTHLTSIFTAIVLYTFGNDQLKGFSISLTVGLVISLFTSLYMTRLMFDYWQHKKWLTNLRMMRFFERPNLNPMKYRYVFFPITGALTLAGIGLFLYRDKEVLNVDFRGGTVYSGRLVEGEERALTTTPDGKPGFRELFAEDRQREKLKVTRVTWLNEVPEERIFQLGSYEFEIQYADGRAPETVTLTQKPDGANKAQMEEAVKERAQKLPDVSVEQMFLTDDPSFENGKSRYFTIRTTERQPELVQIALDRLLRDDGKPLMPQTTMKFEPAGPGQFTLTFDKPTSPSYFKQFLDHPFRREGAWDEASTYDLKGVGDPDEHGRFEQMTLSVSRNSRLPGLNPASGADAATQQTDARTITSVLTAAKAAFEARPVPERLEVFDSQLAQETQNKAFYAILASWLAILLYLWFRFGNWTFGLAAVLCLMHDLCFTLGAIAFCHFLHDTPVGPSLGIEDFKIDLAAVAALLTLVGYSVNEIIVNFARIREVRGKNPALTPQMINDSVNQTLSRTILTSMTVFLVSIVLYTFGGEGVHLFAFVMVMGVMISTYSSIFVASPLLLFLGEGRHEEAPAEEAPKEEEESTVEG